MSITTVTSREFARDHAAAKRAAAEGPVIITDRGRPVYALLRFEEYQRLAGQQAPSLLEALQGESGQDTGRPDFEFPRLDLQVLRDPAPA